MSTEMELKDIVTEAACDYVHARSYAQHCPTKKGYVKSKLRELENAVDDFLEWEQNI